MFNPQNMQKMMEQMGMDMEEVGAKRVVVDLGDEEMVFEKPELNKIKVKGKEMFQLQGDYSTQAKGPSQEDVKMVAEKADVSEDEARKALQEHDEPADAIMSLQ
ncbi:MAG: nascent polypeptide-associated complex protein [Candidatus Nanohaloarchaea archaeon]|nr:nascent polypeptide-associated complex protein [Candidatus Nanohaloarchaea archaeon]